MIEPIDVSDQIYSMVPDAPFPRCIFCDYPVEYSDDYREAKFNDFICVVHASCLRDRRLLP